MTLPVRQLYGEYFVDLPGQPEPILQLKNKKGSKKQCLPQLFFRGAPVPPIVSPDTPIGEAVQPIEDRSTRSSSMPLDRGRATEASLQTEARK